MSVDLSALVLVTVPTCAFLLGRQRMWATAGDGRIVSRRRSRLFLAGEVVLALSLLGPMDVASGERLTVHMVQHVLLVGVAAPLLALGGALPILLWALPQPVRGHALGAWRGLVASAARHPGTWLATAVAAAGGGLLVWHLPALYDAALRDDLVHSAEHVTLVAGSALLWWTVAVSPSPRRLVGGIPALFVMGLLTTGLGAAMTFAASPWYEVPAAPDPMADQQLAGVIMWSVAKAAGLVGAIVLFVTWMVRQPGDAQAPGAEGPGGDDRSTDPIGPIDGSAPPTRPGPARTPVAG